MCEGLVLFIVLAIRGRQRVFVNECRYERACNEIAFDNENASAGGTCLYQAPELILGVPYQMETPLENYIPGGFHSWE